MSSVNLSEETLAEYDLVIIVTDHDAFDYELIEKEAKLIVDTRGRLKKSNNVFKA